MAAMHADLVRLTSDQVDDLIYFSRTGDLLALKEEVETLSKTYSCPSWIIITSAIDVDHEGLGSRSCLLHYPAANGNLAIVEYLLSCVLQETSALGTTEAPDPQPTSQLVEQSEMRTQFVNHRNVSGNTPLHWAGLNDHLAIVQALVKAGADPNIINAAGRDAVVESEWSSKEGATDCSIWLLKECGSLERGVGEEGSGDPESNANDQSEDEEPSQPPEK